MNERAMLAHYYPGEGPPLKLTIAEWNGLVEQLPAIVRMERGEGMTMRELVEREARHAR